MQMDPSESLGLIATQSIIMYLLIAKNRFLSIRMIYILITLCTLVVSVSVLFQDIYVIYIIFIVYFIQLISSFKYTGTWILSVLLLYLQNIILISTWMFTFDLMNMLNCEYVSYLLTEWWLAYLVQVPITLLFCVLWNYADKHFSLWDSLKNVRKKYTVVSLGLVTILFFIIFKRMQAVYLFKWSDFTYLTLILISLLAIIIGLLYFFNNEYKNRKLIELLSRSFDKKEEEVIYAQEMKHDLKNILFGLKQALDVHDIDTAKNIVDEILDISECFFEDDVYDKILTVQSPAIQGILFQFVRICQEKNIVYELEIKNQPMINVMNIIDFLRCASILLNNAIESEAAYIHCSFVESESEIKFTVKNSITNNIKIKNIFKKNFTTKEGHRGLGLYILQKIVKKYGNVLIEMEVLEKLIIFNLIIIK